jgi:hypothetical protein
MGTAAGSYTAMGTSAFFFFFHLTAVKTGLKKSIIYKFLKTCFLKP